MNFLLIFSCFLLINSIRSNDNICQKLTKLSQYKSQIILRYNERELHIEEYRIDDKGKLIIKENGKIEEIYYNNQKHETSVVHYNKNTNDCEQEYLQHTEDEIMPPYKFFDAESGIFGPTGLWSLIEDQFEKLKLNEKMQSDRGIDAFNCEGKVDLIPRSLTTVALFLSEPNWSIFDQKNVTTPQVLKLNIHSDVSVDESSPFGLEIEYIDFQTIDKSEDEDKILNLHNLDQNENIWQIPSVCFRYKRIKPQINIPTEFKMNVQKIDELKHKVLLKVNVVHDEKNDLVSFEKTKHNRTIKQFFKLKQQFFLDFRDGLCTYRSHIGTLEEDHELVFIIQHLLGLKNEEFDQMGNQMVRNIMTDIYVSQGESSEEDVKTYYSIFIGQSNDKTFSNIPIQVRKEKFKLDGDEWRLESSFLYNIYDFEELRTDDQQVNAANLPECDGQNKIEFNLACKNDFNEPMYEQDEIDLKDKLRQELAKVSGETILNFQIMEISIKPKEIISRIKLIDYASPLMYFDIESPDYLIYREKSESDIISNKTYEDCAKESMIISESIGFQSCGSFDKEDYCHVILSTEESEKSSQLVVVKKDYECRAYRKSIKNEHEFKYQTLDEKWINLVNLSKDGKLIIRHLDNDFKFDRIHLLQEELNMDKSMLYKLKAKGYSIPSNLILNSLDVINPMNCYSACTDPKNGHSCDTFSFCRRSHKFECNLDSWLDRNATDKEPDSAYEIDEDCNLYSISSLNHFQDHPSIKLNDEKILNKFVETDSSDCAQLCLSHNSRIEEDDKKFCLSIEVDLSTKTCRLSSAHTLYNSEDIIEAEDNFHVYSVKHILNYHQTEQTVMQGFKNEEVDSVEHCATLCDIEENCEKFNYCDTNGRQFCHFLTQDKENTTKIESDIELLGCTTYVHRKQQLGAKIDEMKFKSVDKIIQSGIGFQIKDIFKFLFSFLLIGFLAGSIFMITQRSKLEKQTDVETATPIDPVQDDEL